MKTGCQVIKETMQKFEENNNAKKEETLLFGHKESGEIRMLGCWTEPKADTNKRIRRAGYLWARVRPQLVKSRLSKRQQAIVIQTCVESGLLFDAALRSWEKGEIKKMQQWIDPRYRYVRSNKKKPPLKTMQRIHHNMQDLRNNLQINTLQWKIEQRSL